MIISNQVECLKCGDRPFSRDRHDMSYCECGAIAVDGGQEYLRRVGDIGNCIDLSIIISDRDSSDIVEEMTLNEDLVNNFGMLCLVMRELRDRNYLK